MMTSFRLCITIPCIFSFGTITLLSSQRSWLFFAAASFPNGHDSCPCLSASELKPVIVSVAVNESLGPLINVTKYGGDGCKAHDVKSAQCEHYGSFLTCESTVPRPQSCDRSWCPKEWCYVDPSNCSIAHKASFYFPYRYYSYATCGYMDRFVNEERIKQLQNRTFLVGYNSNTGGYRGSFSSKGHFATSGWEGPLVEFFDRAAFEGNFKIKRTSPPEELAEKSKSFFSISPFDYCVYATSLGYLDFCVALYTITDERAAAATFFTLLSSPIFLIVFTDESASWDSFWSNAGNVLKPFKLETWGCIFFGVIPIISILITFHEFDLDYFRRCCARRMRGTMTDTQNSTVGTGNAYVMSNSSTEVQKGSPYRGCNECQGIYGENRSKRSIKSYAFSRKTLLARKFGDSIFRGYHALVNQADHRESKTLGGRLTLLGMGFCILTVVASYTANLAAIFNDNAKKTRIESLDDAIKAGYTFCGARKQISTVLSTHHIPEHLIVPDPEDKNPGFNCATCMSRKRTFDFMKQGHSDPSMYCDAALSILPTLQQLQAEGNHCNKTVIGIPISYTDIGIPIYEGISDEMRALLQELKNRGVYNSLINGAKPKSMCPETRGEGMSLSIMQLSGVWLIAIIFAMAGVGAKVSEICLSDRQVNKLCLSLNSNCNMR